MATGVGENERRVSSVSGVVTGVEYPFPPFCDHCVGQARWSKYSPEKHTWKNTDIFYFKRLVPFRSVVIIQING